MTATSQKVRLKFRCDQDFDNMSVGADGKPFCEMCQKSLVDFRTKSLTEIVGHTNKNESCGVFKAEHIDSDLVYQLSFATFRKYFLALGTFLIAETSYSQISTDSVVQTLDTYPSDSTIPKFATPKEEKRVAKKFKNDIAKQNSRYNTRYGIFIKRRFPFVSFRQRIPKQFEIMGYW